MTGDDRENLRRIAYGPDATTEARAEAASALRELDERARVAREALHTAAAAKAKELDESAIVSGVGSEHSLANDDDDLDADDVEPPFWRRRIRVAWLIPITICSLLLGVFGAVGTSSQFRGPDPVTAASDSEVVVPAVPGDLEAADAWFTVPYSAVDYFPAPMVFDSYPIDEHDVRFSGGNGAWVGHTESELCLLVINYDSQHGAGCVSRADFATSGITLSVGSLTFSWRGKDVRVTGRHSVAENVIREAPMLGPGNVDAANSLFDAPATESDAFPIKGALDSSIDPKDLRLVGSDEHWHLLWAAKQRSGGFCLVTYDIRKGETSGGCATLQEFAASGVHVSTGGFAASWNGTEFVATDQLRLVAP